MAAQVDDRLDYRRLPSDGSPPETAHKAPLVRPRAGPPLAWLRANTLPFGFRLARRMRRRQPTMRHHHGRVSAVARKSSAMSPVGMLALAPKSARPPPKPRPQPAPPATPRRAP